MDPPEYVLSSEDLQEICQAFAICDPENNGRINVEDLGTVMRALGQNHTESEIYRYSESLEGDLAGFILLSDFIDLMTKIYKIMEDNDYLRAAFNIFDRDQDGAISATELRNMFNSLGEKISDEQFDEVFRQVDTDGDGMINWSDFRNAYKS
ncbi:calmodulin-2/4 [Drosophila ficusphila]|uniref:calmodulin-2/4 n=1 Tax=Drosophila ficusphila TaxID=30025 RepID=UPI0007E7DDAB|nr:calmodulin-2/4 [Drosophila ficusphila]